MRKLTKKEEKWVEKVITTLRIGGRSEKTISNYTCAINRFLKFHDEKIDIKKFSEEDIIKYIKKEYIDKGRAGDTYNMNICAIKFIFSVCFNKEFNNKLLPNVKLKKRLPLILEKQLFIKIFNEEKNIKHKCWLLLAFCSGLRVEEIATLKIENINSKDKTLKILGKRNKERLTILPNIVIKYLRIYYKQKNIKKKNGFLFEGNSQKEHMNCKSIINYFTNLKRIYNLQDRITFHSLRHSFATYFLKSGGDVFVLKSMLGHSSFNATAIYIHLGTNFNTLVGVKNV